jgi:hypothetical protein
MDPTELTGALMPGYKRPRSHINSTFRPNVATRGSGSDGEQIQIQQLARIVAGRPVSLARAFKSKLRHYKLLDEGVDHTA